MSRLDSGHKRFLVWIGLSAVICFGLYYPQLLMLSNNLGVLVSDTFGTVYSVIPFATLLLLVFALRWGELHRILQNENGVLSAHLDRRLAGAVLTASPLLFQLLARGVADPSGFLAIELGGVTVVFVFYGTSLALNPTTLRFMFPYAALYLAGIVAPVQVQSAFGEPLASFSSALSSWMASAAGVPITWQGSSFTLASRVGGTQISGVVTPGCSSIYSITTFLGLLGLMYVDFRKPTSFTIKVAFAGVLALVLLNAMRITLLLWVGYDFGLDPFLALHNWVGYAIFLGFYVVLLRLYASSKGRQERPGQALPTMSPGLRPTR